MKDFATVTIQSWEEFLTIRRRLRDTEHLLRIRFSVTRDERNHVLAELYRMNIHQASLFPGLDGFAQSLKQRLVLFARSTVRSKKRQ
ncbi:MAG TPA: hypothetical protein PKJ77_05540 [Thermodesulfobacteriota bacterium]|nr:hypothetical protein [Thermodesulfobacteriota bacterium]